MTRTKLNMETGLGHYKKAAIPSDVRVAIARSYGCLPGEQREAWCVYCNAPGLVWWPFGYSDRLSWYVTFPVLELDHVIPEFAGGSCEADNIVLACRACNRAKGHRGSYQPEVKYPASREARIG